ncbi:MAG: phosphate acyltransferase PlsX [Candidatus Eisenbacteria bacterium]|uniref:Phosphate acyltransferase n=1 Tax=Eiseniibacteriota bacterium TaxID=2212470 RepID=A0A7Y2EGG1_UNCEI|nr:phosphate acyltransferase PlsX [Candidatus Eisenbacteria bacterium]
MPVAVDAMGGDHAPDVVIQGACEAQDRYGDLLRPILVGDQQKLEEKLKSFGKNDELEIVHAAQQVAMDESGAGSFRKKRDSSLAVATRLVRDGSAKGVFSAGNTGAMVASSLLNIGRIAGVSRPALATLIPTSRPSQPWVILLDVGATAECKALNLYQYAILGELYARALLKLEQPRVGLLNIGEESSKGTELAQEAHAMMQRRSAFIGNVEGQDILSGNADVVVTDGFSGNVMLKFAESVWPFLGAVVREEIGSNLQSKLGALMLKPSFKRLKTRMDYSEYGGAPLLGVNGISIVGHGRSDAKAVRNGIRFAAQLVRSGLNDAIRTELQREEEGEVVNS